MHAYFVKTIPQFLTAYLVTKTTIKKKPNKQTTTTTKEKVLTDISYDP